MKKITVFDFDGTITSTDSMMAIIIYRYGRWGLAWALLRQMHLIILMMLGLYSNHKTKERLLKYCFGGMTHTELDVFFKEFAEHHSHILRKDMLNRIENTKEEENNRAVIITASPRMWVEKFIPSITVLGTELEFESHEEIFNGHFLTPNCYGQEKVNRLLQAFPEIKEHRSEYHITAYGDSRGDREMLAYADDAHLVKK